FDLSSNESHSLEMSRLSVHRKAQDEGDVTPLHERSRPFYEGARAREGTHIMPIVFGRNAQTVEEIVDVFRAHGDDVRGTYRARYQWDPHRDAYSSAVLERPAFLRDNPAHVVFPWEQIFLAAATCVGADYPMLAAHLGVPLDRVELVVEG